MNQHIWEDVLKLAAIKLSKPSYETWLKSTELVTINEAEKTAIISSENEFGRDWIESRYLHFLEDLLSTVTNNHYRISVKTKQQGIENISKVDTISLPLNPDYTFETFSSSPSNQSAFTAAKSVAQSPGLTYNPLTICGPTGTGKTHLLHAIANVIASKKPNSTVVYMTADHLLTEFVSSIRLNEEDRFRTKLNEADLLIIDDFDTLQGKEHTQEQLLSAMDQLYLQKKQIVFASCKPPAQMQALKDQLKERVKWGVMIEIAKAQDPEGELTSPHISNDTDSENSRTLLEKLLAEQKRTNELLEKIISMKASE